MKFNKTLNRGVFIAAIDTIYCSLLRWNYSFSGKKLGLEVFLSFPLVIKKLFEDVCVFFFLTIKLLFYRKINTVDKQLSWLFTSFLIVKRFLCQEQKIVSLSFFGFLIVHVQYKYEFNLGLDKK
jgi:hypothetical protein